MARKRNSCAPREKRDKKDRVIIYSVVRGSEDSLLREEKKISALKGDMATLVFLKES